MKVSKRQLQSIIKEEKSKLLSERQIGRMVPAQPITRRPIINEQSDNMYLEALESVTTTADDAVNALELASRDIGPSDKALYDKMDEALVILEDLIDLAHQALENADMMSRGGA
tara:strand:- start:242 stop:583 length:342 start_codon:yes stop_codon:yes gene_type:complete